MNIAPAIIRQLHDKHDHYQDALQDLWLELLQREDQLSDEEIMSLAEERIKSAANRRVRDDKKRVPYRDIEVVPSTSRQPSQYVGHSPGSHKADALGKVYPRTTDSEAAFIAALRSSVVNLLSNRDRDLLWARYLHSKTAKELIPEFGDTEQAVWKASQRARGRLEQLVQNCLYLVST